MMTMRKVSVMKAISAFWERTSAYFEKIVLSAGVSMCFSSAISPSFWAM